MLWKVTFPRKQTQKEFCGPEVYLGAGIWIHTCEGGEEGWGSKGRWALVQSQGRCQPAPTRTLEQDGSQSFLEWGPGGWLLYCIMEQSSDMPGLGAIPRGWEGGWAVSSQLPALSAAREMSDSVLKSRGLGGTPVSNIYSNMEFGFSV